MPFWKRDKKPVESKISWDRMDLIKILKASLPEILEKDETPCIGHAIDKIEGSLRSKIRPLTRKAYDDGVLHLIPIAIDGVGEIKRMDVFSMDDEKFKVEKHVRPCEFFLFELMYPEKFLEAVPQDKRDTVVNKHDVWKELSYVEPVFLEGSLDLKESCKFIISVLYEGPLAYRIMKFNTDENALNFLETTDKILRARFLKVLGAQAIEENKLIFKHSVKGVDILTARETDIPTRFSYAMRWRHRDKVFNVWASEQKAGIFFYGYGLFETYRSNCHHLQNNLSKYVV